MEPIILKESLNKLMPQPCPVNLIRIGGCRDGAYLVPNDLDGIEACFSPGVNNFKYFEDELSLRFGIKCHMCDFSSDIENFETPLINRMQSFEKKWLDIDGGAESITLEEWVDRHCGKDPGDLLLQIDIEGAEFRNLNSASLELMNKFRILILELHVPIQTINMHETLEKEFCPLLDKLSQTHICVHLRANNCCGDFVEKETGLNIPNVIEVAYLRRDRFNRDPKYYYQPQLPHPLDIPFNLPEVAPLHLNKNWLIDKRRSLESELKICKDFIVYEAEGKPRIISLSYLFRGLASCNNDKVRSFALRTALAFRLVVFHIYYQIKNLGPLLTKGK